MTNILEALIAFTISNPIGFLTAATLLLFTEYVIFKSIINDPYKAPSATYIADAISIGVTEVQLTTLKITDALLSTALSLVKKVEKEADWQLYKLYAHDSQKLIAPAQTRFALQRANTHHHLQ